VQIVNGRRSEWRRITHTFRYRIEASEAGTYTIPPLTVTQGGKRAATRAAAFTVQSVATTEDMQLHLVLPERPVWIGETFAVKLQWLLRRDVGEHSFVIPLFDLDHVQVEPGSGHSGRSLAFNAGAVSIKLPYSRTVVTVNGVQYNRLEFLSRVTVNRAGTIDVAPAKVAASLQVGDRRDAFGFRVPEYRLFTAQDKPQRLVVRPLPVEGRPASFENAIGSAFSINVQASRTVVQVGDPIELEVRIRGDGPLAGLSLPRLDGKDGLSADLFAVPEDPPVGVLDAEGRGKTFKVTVRVKSAAATEIPPLAFSYFDPVAGAYRTIRSDPIALSVSGSAVVSAADVEAARPVRMSEASDAGASAPGGLANLIGADLSLSAADATFRDAWSAAEVMPWVLALYLFPLIAVGTRVWQVRTRERRGRAREIKQALHRVDTLLDSGKPAREAAPQVVAALRTLALLTGHQQDLTAGALEALETNAFDPEAGERPLSSDLCEPVRTLAREWACSGPQAEPGRRLTIGAALVLGMWLTAAGGAPLRASDSAGDQRLRSAREIYKGALAASDRVLRLQRFGEAERLFAQLVADHPASPELLTDWGNAALGSRDIGRAVLAYRRALHRDPSHARAQKNLSWLRSRAPEWLPRPSEKGVWDSLFFWHRRLTVPQRHIIGAAAFAAGMMLLAPWSRRRKRLLRRISVGFFAVWLGAAGSAVLANDPSQDAVVMTDATMLRSADSVGAPSALPQPMPAGTEVRILENREPWTRIELADGSQGWVGSSAIVPVAP
jgi:hypothetical protein